MSDQILCDCNNRFNVFDAKPYQRTMSCIVCHKEWRIGCSGRRLYSIYPHRTPDSKLAYDIKNAEENLP